MKLETLEALGFDLSCANTSDSTLSVRCSRCDALVINGVPTHEHGCPNAMHECAGCNEIIPMRQRYCADCA